VAVATREYGLFINGEPAEPASGETRDLVEPATGAALATVAAANEQDVDRAVDAAREALDAHYADELGEPFTTAGLCLYRDGRDSVAWHGDTIGRGKNEDTMVAILAIGTPRALLLRPRGGGGPTLRHNLGHGDLLVMGGSCQRTWEHAIPKTASAVGPRISIQFRPHDVR
jgi:alkylated DNA repair dioxygenase AlkB